MAETALSASVGVDFSLIGTKLHAVYEKNGADGYAVLLIPSEQTADNGVSIGQVIADIKGLISKVDDKADTSKMEEDLKNGVSGLTESASSDKSFDLNNLIIKLNMAYLYIRKSSQESTVEYAFQLQVVTKDVIPAEIQQLVTVDNISISVWNTTRKQVVDKMALVTVNEYLGISEQKGLPAPKSEAK